MSERYVVRIINGQGKITGDYFVKYLSDERIKDCINDAIEYAKQNYLNVKNGSYDMCTAIIPFQFMNCLNGRLIEKGNCWAPTNLDGFYLVDFQQKKAYYYHMNDKIWNSKEWKELDKTYDYSYSDKNSEEYKLYQEANNNFRNMIDSMLKPYINGIYPQYDKCADGQKLIYDFNNLYPQPSMDSKEAKINKIAKKIISRNTYDSIDEETLKHFQNFLKNELNNRWSINSHDGSSYDGFISFTEGYVEAITTYNGWEQMELFPDDSYENYKYCVKCFCRDHSELFEGKSEKQAIKIIDQFFENKDYDNEIWKQYENYESEWMSDECGSLFVAIQFYANGESYNTQSWTCSIYAGKGDTYGRRQEYLFEDSIDFLNDTNKPTIIKMIESKIKEAIYQSDFDSLD